MEKYLGNKRAVLDAIYDVVRSEFPSARTVCDIFAGTTNVGRYFRARDFDVFSNDINRFSFILGATYLALNKAPAFRDVPKSTDTAALATLERTFYAAAIRDRGQLFPKARIDEVWAELRPTAGVLAYLDSLKPRPCSIGPIVDYFTMSGRYSNFTSLRGSTGQRNYFSDENASRLDVILDTIADWWRTGRISLSELCVLMTSVLEEVVIVANVNGTFHDFNRNRLWPNSLQRLTLRVPLTFAREGEASQVFCQDASEVIGAIPPHDLLYVDPPYNFRQYSAYYHFLNFIAAFPFLADRDAYLASLSHVRGQNMEDDFTSAFCFRERFVAELRRLFIGSSAKAVVMSYYGGRNHWNHWSRKETPTDEGRRVLQELFEDNSVFSSAHCIPVLQLRQNYQSRIGEHKKFVDEHLFVGTLARDHSHQVLAVKPSPSVTNTRFGLELLTHLVPEDAQLKTAAIESRTVGGIPERHRTSPLPNDVEGRRAK